MNGNYFSFFSGNGRTPRGELFDKLAREIHKEFNCILIPHEKFLLEFRARKDTSGKLWYGMAFIFEGIPKGKCPEFCFSLEEIVKIYKWANAILAKEEGVA